MFPRFEKPVLQLTGNLERQTVQKGALIKLERFTQPTGVEMSLKDQRVAAHPARQATAPAAQSTLLWF